MKLNNLFLSVLFILNPITLDIIASSEEAQIKNGRIKVEVTKDSNLMITRYDQNGDLDRKSFANANPVIIAHPEGSSFRNIIFLSARENEILIMCTTSDKKIYTVRLNGDGTIRSQNLSQDVPMTKIR